MKKHYRSENNCLNCDTLVPDKFCPSCGQENLELHESFLHLALHSIEHYFHLESKFFKSIVPLLTKPGYLTKEYFAGRRASYLNPFSMYISISILFFFLFTANTNINKKEILKEKAGEEKTVTDKESTGVKGQATTKARTTADKTALVTSPETEEAPASKDEITIGNWEVPIHGLNAKFREVKHDEIKNALFRNKLVSHLPKMMFILLPLFALILKLVSTRSKKFYTEHLIYSIHVHSFLFLFGSMLILLKWLLPSVSGWIQFLGILVMLWYIYRSMRNIYNSTRWRTVMKFLLLAFAYTFLFFVSGLTVVIATLYTM